MKIHSFSLATLLATSVLLTDAIGQTTATTDPVGFVTVGITAGTGIAKRNTFFSVPMLETQSITGQVSGVITGVTSNSISNSNAGWTAGALSRPATPYLIQITSGAAEGHMFLIASSTNTGGAIAGTANTATTVTVGFRDTAQVDLTTLGILTGTDTYKIYACDTLSSFFGAGNPTGVDAVRSGSAAASADTIMLFANGSATTYFYSTSSNRWTRVALFSPDASNVPIHPYYGLQFQRLAGTSLSFIVTGDVPMEKRKAGIKNSGSTFLSQYWPAGSTLSSIGLHNLPGWQSGSSASVADTVILTSSGSVNTYFYNGTNWKRVALFSPNSDATPVPIGTSVSIVKKGLSTGFATLTQQPPYTP